MGGDRYDRQRLGKSFFEAKDWAKWDERQETDRLISRLVLGIFGKVAK